jgi:hypothetical protein
MGSFAALRITGLKASDDRSKKKQTCFAQDES